MNNLKQLIKKLLSSALAIVIASSTLFPLTSVKANVQNSGVQTVSYGDGETGLIGPSPEGDLTPDGLFITEINPNDISRDATYGSGSNDLMEYVEIANTTSEAVYFNDSYTIKYAYLSGSLIKEKALTVSSFDSGNVKINAHSCAIFWVYRESDTNLYKKFPTLSEFRQAYNIPDNIPVYKMTGQSGLGNEDRGMNLYYGTTSVSSYWWTSDDEADGKCIQLRVNFNSPNMLPYSRKAALTAGYYDEAQVAYIPDYGTPPALALLDTSITSVDEGEQLFIPYSVKDQDTVTAAVYYKTSNDNTYTKIATTSFAVPEKYYMMIPSDKLIGCDYVDYYVMASNTYRTTTTEERRIAVNRSDAGTGIRLNLKDDALVTGSTDFVARSFANDGALTINLDGKQLDTASTLEQYAFFTFQYSGVDSYFKNGLTTESTILGNFSKCNTIPSDSSMAIKVDRQYFYYNNDGTASITLTLRTGTWGSTWESDTAANNDDFTVTNLYLKLTDGTIISPTNIIPTNTYKIGDSSGYVTTLDMNFVVPADKLNAIWSKMDTTKLTDGTHTLKAKTAGGTEKTITFTVDNTSPVISINLKDGDNLKSLFTPTILTNDISKIDTILVSLDGKELTGEYSFNAADLTEGQHILKINSKDAAGNASEKIVTFTSENGYSTVESIKENASGKSTANITVQVNGDDSEVTLYEGQAINNITIMEGAGDSTENSVIKEDTSNTTVSNNGENPYQIFQIPVDANDNDTIRISTKATTDYGKDVSLYILNILNNSWENLNAKSENGTLNAEFAIANHTKDGKAQVLAVAGGSETSPKTIGKNQTTSVNNYNWDGTGIPKQYDFSLAWITDTQYYSESWPDNYFKETNWIVANKDVQNIIYTIHTGDIVDDYNEDFEWKTADAAMKVLDNGEMPYGVLGGNHDVAHGNMNYDNYWKYFGENRFANSPVYGGSYKNNLGHYDLVSANGVDMIFVYMSWDIYTDELNWMNDILSKYSERKAIICLHGGIDANATESYTSELILNEVCSKNKNVIAILNGHYHGAAINTVGFDDNGDGTDDRSVYQICTDYQSADQGGLSYIKMLYFDLANGKIYVNSYSPLLNDYNYYDTNRLDSYGIGTVMGNIDIYELEADFNRTPKSLTVSDFKAVLCNGKEIGTAKTINNTAVFYMNNLVNAQKYMVYAKSVNSLLLTDNSSIIEFTFNSVSKGGSSHTSTDSSTDTSTGNPTDNSTEGSEGTNDGSTNGSDSGSSSSPAGSSTNSSTDGSKDNSTPETHITKFTDTPGHWAEKAIEYVLDKGLFKGTSDDKFTPDGEITRSMFVTVLWRLAGTPTTDALQSFSDIKSDAWYYNSAMWAYDNDIAKGSESGFNPEASITREQLMTMLYRYAKYKGIDMTSSGDISKYPDGKMVSEWASGAMNWAIGAGLINGNQNGNIEAQATATRAEVATILMRFIENINK